MSDTTTKQTEQESSAEKVLAIAAELTAAKRQLREQDARKMRDAQLRDEQEERARKAAEPPPPPLPEPIARMLEQDAALEAYLAGSVHNDAEAGYALAGIGYRRRAVEREQARRHRSELARVIAGQRAEPVRLSPRMASADDVMIVGARAFGGRSLVRPEEKPREVATAGAFSFVSVGEWENGLREVHEAAREDYVRRRRDKLASDYGHVEDLLASMLAKIGPQFERDADNEIGFALVGDARWDIASIARRFMGTHDPGFPTGPLVESTVNACRCPLARVRWALVARSREAMIPALERWLGEAHETVRIDGDTFEVRAALDFWAQHDRQG